VDHSHISRTTLRSNVTPILLPKNPLFFPHHQYFSASRSSFFFQNLFFLNLPLKMDAPRFVIISPGKTDVIFSFYRSHLQSAPARIACSFSLRRAAEFLFPKIPLPLYFPLCGELIFSLKFFRAIHAFLPFPLF